MTEVPHSASLHWKLDESERARVHDAMTGRHQRYSVDHEYSLIALHNDPLHAIDRIGSRTTTKHKAHWSRLEQLGVTSTSFVTPFLRFARQVVYNLLVCRHISVTSWRVEHSFFGWDENLFLAVFSSLGAVQDPSVLRRRQHKAVSFDAAWATQSVYMKEILARPSIELENWCSFQDFKPRKK